MFCGTRAFRPEAVTRKLIVSPSPIGSMVSVPPRGIVCCAMISMKIELGEKNATIFALEAREKAMKEQLRATEEEFSAKTELLRSAEYALTDKQAELSKINHAPA